MTPSTSHYDVLIIGSGAAGLAVALTLPNAARIAILSKETLSSGSSQHAQGGIAAVMDAEDSLESHIQDTLKTGCGLCDLDTVTYTITHAKEAILWLIEQGVQFTKTSNNSSYHLTQEGGHSHRRIVHAADKTGAVVVKTLTEQVLARTNIDCLTEHAVVDLLINNRQCYGTTVFDESTHECKILTATHVVLATGGANSLYLHASNPSHNTGDGIAMAWRAGCRIANLEFIQFHPTCLHHPKANSFLITEVVRGEGGHLTLPNGERFMKRYDVRGELAPRDIVARAIHSELQKNHLDYVYLNISHQPKDFIMKSFPTIYARCKEFGIDLTKDPIPVVPAAHYTCGGIMTNINGETDIKNLYAVGEVAHTGLHGANRMASNSLLECLVFAKNTSLHIREKWSTKNSSFPLPAVSQPKNAVQHLDIASTTLRIKKILWDKAGIVRSNTLLTEAEKELADIATEINAAYPFIPLSAELIELRNMILVAELIVRSAIKRHESRGLHYNVDYPDIADTAKDTILTPTRSIPA